jgi:hypothetical protein
MLFHFSFYSNKQPAVPACSHNHSVELGEYHLSEVKFPGKVADQSRLGISELVLRSFRLGLNAARANFLPALAAKTLVDQFLYTPFLSNPMQTLAFLWKSEQFSLQRTVEKMRQFRQFYVLTVLPVLMSNWLFWIPMVVLIYCFPTSLQLPLGILACAIWSMLLTALVEPADARVRSTKE